MDKDVEATIDIYRVKINNYEEKIDNINLEIRKIERALEDSYTIRIKAEAQFFCAEVYFRYHHDISKIEEYYNTFISNSTAIDGLLQANLVNLKTKRNIYLNKIEYYRKKLIYILSKNGLK